MKKKPSIILMVTVIMSLLTACGGANNKPTTTSTEPGGAAQEPKKEITLKLSLWGDDTRKKLYEDYGKKFKETHPHVNLEIMLIPIADYQQKLSILLASKTGPDIAWLNERAVSQFLDSGQLLDVSEIKNDAAYDFGDMYPSTFDLFTKQGKIYGVPFSSAPKMLFFNKNLFKEKGLKTPLELVKEGKWTYEEFVKTAKALTDPTKGTYGVNLFESGGWKSWNDALTEAFWANGAELFSEDGTQFLLNSKEGEQVIQMYYDMLFKDKSHLMPGDQTTFDSGKIGMSRQVYSYSGKANKITGFEWDIAPMPTGTKKDAPVAVGMSGYVIMKDTKHPKETLELLKFFTSKAVETELTKFYLPNRKSVLESDSVLKVGKPSEEAIKATLIDPMSKGVRVQPAHKNWQQFDVKMQTLFDFLYTKTKTPKELLELMEKEVTPLLK